MKKSILEKHGINTSVIEILDFIIALIPWPNRRIAIGYVVATLLDGKPRTAEKVFGWKRTMVQLGVDEYRSGIQCINDISGRKRPRVEERDPQLLADIKEIIDPQSQSDARLRTTLLYTKLTAPHVHMALQKKGWSAKDLPTIRTLSNILNRHGYRLRRVEKSKVQKKTSIPTPFSKMSGSEIKKQTKRRV